MRKATLQDLKLELWLRNHSTSSIIWTTKDNRSIPINEMTDRHLVNTINMLERAEKRKQEEEDSYWDIMDMGLMDGFDEV